MFCVHVLSAKIQTYSGIIPGFLHGVYKDLQEIYPAFQPICGYCQNLLQPAWYQSTRSFDCVKMTKQKQDLCPATQIRLILSKPQVEIFGGSKNSNAMFF
jgi:hypothetical protein